MVGALGFAVFLFISLLLYIVVRNRDNIRKVRPGHRLIVVIAFVCLLIFPAIATYYAGNWLAASIEHESLKFAFHILWTLINVAIITWVCESLISRIKRKSGIL